MIDLFGRKHKRLMKKVEMIMMVEELVKFAREGKTDEELRPLFNEIMIRTGLFPELDELKNPPLGSGKYEI